MSEPSQKKLKMPAQFTMVSEPPPSPTHGKIVMGHEKRGYMSGVNAVPTDASGYVLHLGLKKGELANRVIVVGSDSRARRVMAHLDDPEKCFTKTSDRSSFSNVKILPQPKPVFTDSISLFTLAPGFTTYTGTFGGVHVSVCATGMGAPMMDFFVSILRIPVHILSL